jgi:hypothetical protein
MTLQANHERIREALRQTLSDTARADEGDLVAALALGTDLTGIVRALDEERVAAPPGEPLRRALAAARETVVLAARSLSYVFSVYVVLECVAAIATLLDDVERAAA